MNVDKKTICPCWKLTQHLPYTLLQQLCCGAYPPIRLFWVFVRVQNLEMKNFSQHQHHSRSWRQMKHMLFYNRHHLVTET